MKIPKAIQERASIPAAKRKTQWVKTIGGGVVFGGGFLLPLIGYPWYAGVGVAGFGAFLMSQQLILAYLTAIPQAIGAIVSALGGRKPDA